MREISGKTRVYAVVGRPVQHSLSPAIFNPLFAHHGIDAVYVALDVDPARASQLGTTLRTLGLSGANLTVPFKAAVLDELDDVSELARATGAVNVVCKNGDRMVGHNTDAEGFSRALEQAYGPVMTGQEVVVLGVGGAGRAVAAGAASRGAATVHLLNRTFERASRAAERLGEAFPRSHFVPGELTPDRFAQIGSRAGVIVNCTSGSASERISALNVESLMETAIWCDINYWMANPPQLDACRRRGVRVQTGLDMLVHQGALAFELFIGHPAELSVVKRVLTSPAGTK